MLQFKNGKGFQSVTPSNILSGFHACGIYPFNSKAIPSEAYIPNSLYAVRGAKEMEAGSLDTADSTVSMVSQACEQVKNQSQSYTSESTDTSVPVPRLFSSSADDPQVIPATPE